MPRSVHTRQIHQSTQSYSEPELSARTISAREIAISRPRYSFSLTDYTKRITERISRLLTALLAGPRSACEPTTSRKKHRACTSCRELVIHTSISTILVSTSAVNHTMVSGGLPSLENFGLSLLGAFMVIVISTINSLWDHFMRQDYGAQPLDATLPTRQHPGTVQLG